MNLLNKLDRYKQIIQVLGIYLFLSFAGCFMVVVRIILTGQTGYKFLIWNLFLTWIPLSISLLMNYIYVSFKPSIVRAMVLLFSVIIWSAFYPNAPYIITDFIHLSGVDINFYFTSTVHSMNLLVWYDFMMITLFILTGFLIGFVSLYLIQRLLIDRFNSFIGWIFVGGMLFISSYGIYLGRFIRWNSWDIVTRPKILITSIFGSFHRYPFAFTITFGLFLILIYCALYYLTNLNDYKVAFNERYTI